MGPTCLNITMDWATGLVAATALHLGFQLTVTVLVYPALATVPAERWVRQHGLHSRRVVPLVAVVYLALVVSLAGRLAAEVDPAALATAGACGLVLVLTAAFASPLHTRLGRGLDPTLVRRLLLVDRIRCLGAVVALVFAVLS